MLLVVKDCDSYKVYNPQSNTWILSEYKLESKKYVLTWASLVNSETVITPQNISTYYLV